MFVENVPAVFISDPSQLKSGMELWSCGQGGVSEIIEPHSVGKVVGIGFMPTYRPDYGEDKYEEGDYAFTTTGQRISYLDGHIMPQMYNNWYYCDSAEKAQEITDFLKANWTAEHEHDRKEFDRETRHWFD